MKIKLKLINFSTIISRLCYFFYLFYCSLTRNYILKIFMIFLFINIQVFHYSRNIQIHLS